MLAPPLDPGQRRTVQWGGPLACGVMWGGWTFMRGGEPHLASGVGAAALLLGLGWTSYALGRSRFGSQHGRMAPWALSVLVLWPLGAVLLPRQWVGTFGLPDVALWALHAAVLATAATLHARAAAKCSPPGQRSWAWSGVTVDPVRRRLSSARVGAAHWSSIAIAAASSASVYGALKAQFDAPTLVLLVTAMSNAIAFYLYAGPFGRQLGQAWQLRRIERAEGGPPFEHEAVAELERLRAKSLLYRRRG